MSNRRRPERRDAHGAPVRTKQEIWTAVGVVVGVLALTIVLLIAFRHRPASSTVTTPSSIVSTSSTTKPSGSTTSSSTATSSSTSSTSATSKP
jgi:cytoskeletal protein RodZ